MTEGPDGWGRRIGSDGTVRTKCVLAYTYDGDVDAHERWLTQWGLEWTGCAAVEGLTFSRGREDGRLAVRVTIETTDECGPAEWGPTRRRLLDRLTDRVDDYLVYCRPAEADVAGDSAWIG